MASTPSVRHHKLALVITLFLAFLGGWFTVGLCFVALCVWAVATTVRRLL
jgi:hypothetical protein